MTISEILNQSTTKRNKAEKLFSLGYTRRQVAEILCNGNYGYAHNLWKKWNEMQGTVEVFSLFEFAFNRNFGVEVEFFGSTKTVLTRNLNNCGVNYEFESYNHTARNHWKFTTDSSIIGGNGREMVSPVLSGNEGLKSLRNSCKALRLSAAKVNKSCGIHVHLDVNDFSVPNMRALVKNWFLLEYQFDKMMPVSRRQNNNIYCKSLSSLFTKRELFSNLDSCTTINEIINLFETRYVKLNLKSYLRYGTVEFRHHSGTTMFSKIKNWILICARLVEFSKQNEVLLSNINQILDENLQEYVEERELDFL
ncbi:amidoligase family protein [Tenacibaculum maritimum]|uniref:amidoligase family protein n=1 Tax=Tenacibaculum maritimum TaxID=107401 RepID=UPI0038778779